MFPIAPNRSSRSLLLEIARCPLVPVAAERGSHPCHAVVSAQQSVPLGNRHVPEPWSGMISSAPILFVSSNPAINPNESFPHFALSLERDPILSHKRDQCQLHWSALRGAFSGTRTRHCSALPRCRFTSGHHRNGNERSPMIWYQRSCGCRSLARRLGKIFRRLF